MNTPGARRHLALVVTAWLAMLLVSDLPDVLLHAFGLGAPHDLPWAKAGVAALLLVTTLTVRALRPLLGYALVLLVLHLALRGSAAVMALPAWQRAWGGEGVGFVRGYVGVFLPDLAVALVVLLALWALRRRRERFFLAVGALDAPVRPVRWLGIRQGESWRTFGWIFGGVAAVVVIATSALSLHPTAAELARAAPLLLAGVAFSAVNAFDEEVYFRASLLATLPDAIGADHALLLNAVFFGLAHWLYGSPSGLPGFLMTGFLAWLMGKAMLETRGLGWPWLIHFMVDIPIFAAYAIAFVRR